MVSVEIKVRKERSSADLVRASTTKPAVTAVTTSPVSAFVVGFTARQCKLESPMSSPVNSD